MGSICVSDLEASEEWEKEARLEVVPSGDGCQCFWYESYTALKLWHLQGPQSLKEIKKKAEGNEIFGVLFVTIKEECFVVEIISFVCFQGSFIKLNCGRNTVEVINEKDQAKCNYNSNHPEPLV